MNIQSQIEKIKQQVAEKIHRGSGRSVEIIRNVTPVDTQRLFESIEAEKPVIQGNNVCCKIRLGGKTLYGIKREQNIKRAVNYAVYVEAKTGFVRSSVPQIRSEILSEFQ
ncbi:hypothetical protein NIES2100_05570 [Calothrix sp. NIES-2100]|uniref:hypothetical protein n=1 Tax=Calothrix sp. NIES-2100 TaxID=1954172 RepID=UPI000B6008D5|nr:hypothetical protein NIES2100_05570 [Calothrix sp. NIES-2100]